MLRWVLYALVALVLLAGAGVFYIDWIATGAIERGGSYALGVDTQLESVTLRPFAGRLGLGGLTIANPSGFDAAHFLKLGSGQIAVSIGSLRQDPVVIDRVELSDIAVTIERNSEGTNYDAILAHLAERKPEPSGRGVVIEELWIRDVDASLRMGGLGSFDVHIPEIALTKLGSGEKDGLEIAEVIAVVTKAVLTAIARESAELPINLAQDLGARLARVGLPGVKLPDRVGEESRKLQERIGEGGEAARKLLDGVGDLLGR